MTGAHEPERRKLVTLHLPLEMGLAVDVMAAVAKHYPDAPVGDVLGSVAAADGGADCVLYEPERDALATSAHDRLPPSGNTP